MGYADFLSFAGLCPGPDLARSGQGVAAGPADSRPGAAGCPALSGGLFGMDLVALIAGPIVFRYPFLSLLFDEACDVRWHARRLRERCGREQTVKKLPRI